MALAAGLSPREAKAELFALVERELASTSRGSRASLADVRRLDELVARLEAAGPIDDPKRTGLLAGAWQLLYTLRSNTGVEQTEWLTYLLQNGPSPIQRFVIGSVAQVSLVYQTLDEGLTRFVNVIDFMDALGGRLNLEAAVDSVDDDGTLNIRFDNAFFLFEKNPLTKQPLGEPKRLPYPVPFRLLPNESRGFLKTTFLDGELRLARGNRGSVFILRRMGLEGRTAATSRAA
ncbi:hypothetical protein KFE25_009732 [Diacronema lutheri]|uniref:Plastid lipid-associated protein/fibrillin conserved domain-containing protein n=2 Tax=Diacronema lutheri TaxID=2081491 RepID=A0A8J5XL13_DIALT|nr:hypothetical protein KFE25_009732 [Diacronema lutheri]